MAIVTDYKYIRLEGTRKGIFVAFLGSKIFAADVIQGIGRELLLAADIAAQVDMPLVVSFRGIEEMSSAMIGKLVLLNRKVKSVGVKLRFCDLSPAAQEVFGRLRVQPRES